MTKFLPVSIRVPADVLLVRRRVRKIAAHLLEIGGRLLETAGAEAVRKLSLRAVPLDLGMPGMSGFDGIEMLQADPATSHTPAVIMAVKPLAAEELARLQPLAAGVLSKEVLSVPGAATRLTCVFEGAGNGTPAKTNHARS